MIVAIIVSALAVLFAYWAKENSKWLIASFVIIALFHALRYGFGSDYMAYLDIFNELKASNVNLFDFNSLLRYSIKSEIGWTVINILCRPIGFFGMMALLAAFENWVIYRFVKRYVSPNVYWVAVFFYAFSALLFLIGACSMMRQWLATIFFLLAFQYIEERKPIRCYLLIICAISVHTSAWILAPFYFITYIPQLKKIRYQFVIIAFALYILWDYYAPTYISNNMDILFETDTFKGYEQYSKSIRVGQSRSMMGWISFFVQDIIMTILVLVSIPKLPKKHQLIGILYCLSFLLTPLTYIIPSADRLAYYFSIFGICAVPMAIDSFPKRSNPFVYGIWFMYMIFYLWSYWNLQYGASWITFQEYYTIFSAPNWM